MLKSLFFVETCSPGCQDVCEIWLKNLTITTPEVKCTIFVCRSIVAHHRLRLDMLSAGKIYTWNGKSQYRCCSLSLVLKLKSMMKVIGTCTNFTFVVNLIPWHQHSSQSSTNTPAEYTLFYLLCFVQKLICDFYSDRLKGISVHFILTLLSSF